jgi:hypothetical protein
LQLLRRQARTEEAYRASRRCGSSADSDLRTLKNVCRDDPEALNLIDVATQREHGGDRSKIDNVQLDPTPTGNSRDAALRRLRKDRPDLHKEVIAGKKTAHRAMVEAGFRKAPTALEAAKKAVAKLTEKEWQELLRWRKESTP